MTNIVILDDDRENASDLSERVDLTLSDGRPHHITVVSTFDELADTLASREQVDIFITDIVMPEGQPSGIEVVRRYFPASSGTQVIYVSGYLDQALEVYPSNHIFFLLKPIDNAKLEEALNLALSSIERSKPTMLRVKSGHKEKLVNVTSIRYLRSNLRKVTIFCRNDEIETYARLDEVSSQLPSEFVRCHRSYVVNLAQVSSLQEDHALLHDGTHVPVSRRRVKDVQRALLAYITGRRRQA